MSAHPEYRDQIAAYALDSLELPEALELERHLAGCEACNEYLAWLRPAVDLLPASVEQRTPPPSLKRSLMGEVQADLKAERKAEKAQARSERGFWGAIWRPATAGILSTVLVAGAIVGYLLAGSDAEGEFFEVEKLAESRAEMDVSLEVRDNAGTLHVTRLPGTPPYHDYQAWIEHDGEMVPSSTFDVREDGEVEIDGSLKGADGVYITLEPEDGSEVPTAPVLMGVELS